MQRGWSPHGVVVVGSPELCTRDGFPAYGPGRMAGASRAVGVVGTSAFHERTMEAIYQGTRRTIDALTQFIDALDDSPTVQMAFILLRLGV